MDFIEHLKAADWKTIVTYALNILCYFLIFLYNKKVSNKGLAMDVLFKDKVKQVDDNSQSLTELVNSETAAIREELEQTKKDCAAAQKRCEDIAIQFIGTQRALRIYLGLELEDEQNCNNAQN